MLFALAATTALAPAAHAAANLTSATVSGPSGTVWNTTVDSFYALFLQRPIGNLLNPNDNFSGSVTTEGMNNFAIFGEGFPSGGSANSDPVYTLTLNFADGAAISGNYVGSTFTFTPGSAVTVGNTTYSMNGFGWDRSRADNVSAFQAVSGGDPADYTGQFSYNAVTAIAAVPEPATWAMLLLGFGVLGGALRTRTRQGRDSRLALRMS